MHASTQLPLIFFFCGAMSARGHILLLSQVLGQEGNGCAIKGVTGGRHRRDPSGKEATVDHRSLMFWQLRPKNPEAKPANLLLACS